MGASCLAPHEPCMPASLTSPRSRRDLRGFLELLEHRGALRRITAPVDPDLELAAIADRVLAAGGPGLLFENVIGSSMPVAINLLGTQERVLWSLGMERPEELEALGERLALLQQPRPPRGPARRCASARCCWMCSRPGPTWISRPLPPTGVQRGGGEPRCPAAAAPLAGRWGRIITLGLVITKDPETGTPNVGVYRLQQQSINTMTVHWLSVRGGARHLRKAAALGKNWRSPSPSACTPCW